MMNFGKSRARMSTPDDKKVTFKDVAGLQEEKEDLEEVVDFLDVYKRQLLWSKRNLSCRCRREIRRNGQGSS